MSSLTDKEIEILNYCSKHLNITWAAIISSIILECDFKDVSTHDYFNKSEKKETITLYRYLVLDIGSGFYSYSRWESFPKEYNEDRGIKAVKSETKEVEICLKD